GIGETRAQLLAETETPVGQRGARLTERQPAVPFLGCVVTFKVVDPRISTIELNVSPHQTDLRSWLQDALDFIIERIEMARSPDHQAAAITEAQGLIPFLHTRLMEHQALALNFYMLLGFYIDATHSSDMWAALAKESPQTFAQSADDLVGRM